MNTNKHTSNEIRNIGRIANQVRKENVHGYGYMDLHQ